MTERCIVKIPKLSLVVLIGPSGSGKSTFARKHFLPTEVLSSDACRALVSDDENNQAVTQRRLRRAALHRRQAARPRAADGRRRHQRAARGPAPLVALARKYHCLPVAIVLNLPEEVCQERNRAAPTARSARTSSATAVATAAVAQGAEAGRLPARLRPGDAGGGRSGGRRARAAVERPHARARPVRHHRRRSRLLRRTGGTAGATGLSASRVAEHEPGWSRSRLSRIPRAARRSSSATWWTAGRGSSTRCASFATWCGRLGPVRARQPRHEAAQEAPAAGTCRSRTAWPNRSPRSTPCPTTCGRRSRKSLAEFLDGLVSHYVLDGGKLVVAHAGMKAEMQGRGSGKVRDFALYGETTGETDEFGLPVRYNWAAEYRGSAMVVYGHTPVPEPEWLNRTVNIDTGCVFGGKLTALRYPEKEFVSVPPASTYCEPARPFLAAERAGAEAHRPAGSRRRARRRGRAGQADRLDPAARQRHDPGGERHGGAGSDEPVRRQPEVADLPAAHHVAVRDEHDEPGLLEHPAEAFAYYRSQGARRSSAKRSTWGRGPS